MTVRRTYDLNKMANAMERKYMPQMINDIADVVHNDIIDGIRGGKDLDNSATKPLKTATITAKTRKGYSNPRLPRVATGAMSGALGTGGPFISQQAKKGTLKAIIRSAARAFYGKFQQTGRPWFGIAKRTERTVEKIIKVKTIQGMKSAHVRGI